MTSFLKQMRKFYQIYADDPIGQTLSDQLDHLPTVSTGRKFPLSWSNYLKLMRIDNVDERHFYEIEATQNHWGLRELQRQFDSALYERLALSRNKDKVMELSEKGQIIENPQDMLKDPYILEFTGLQERSEYSETELESRLLDHLQEFLLELGKGFAFIGRQVRFTFDEQHIDDKLFVAKLQYTVATGEQGKDWNSDKLKGGAGFVAEKSQTFTLERTEGSLVKYDLVGKVAEGAKLTRRSTARILSDIKPYTFAMFKNNPEEFIAKTIRLINEQKATMIVEQITYNKADGNYDANIFTAEKNTDYSKAYCAKKNVQDYVLADGYARDGQSIERKFAEDMDLADEVCVYAKLPKGFSIPTPVGNYSPDWAIAFHKGTVKHIFFVAETKGTMETLNLKPIEKAKIDCARKLFKELSGEDVVYDSVDSYQHLMDIMGSL